MKSFISKKALTLVELVISITISTIVMLIVLTFVADSIETVISSNKKTEIYEDLFSFKDIFSKYARWGYIDQNLLATTATGSQSDIMLMENFDSSQGVVFWVINKETMSIEKQQNYELYYDKVLWYRQLSETELTNINSNPSLVYDLQFFPDKIFDGLKMKDFQMAIYNSGTIIDMDLEVLLYYNDSNKGLRLDDINPEDIININLIF